MIEHVITFVVVVAGIVLLPFIVFLLSKMQMLGWLAALKNHIDYERKTEDGEKTENK